MLQYGGPKLAFSRAETVGAVGLQDQAAEDQLNGLLEDLELTLEPAFESVAGWLEKGGPNGAALNIKSFSSYVLKVQQITTELAMVIGMLSKASLEQHLDNVISCVLYMQLILTTAAFLADKEVAHTFASMPTIGSESVTTVVPDISSVKEEPPTDTDGHARRVDGRSGLGDAGRCSGCVKRIAWCKRNSCSCEQG